VETYNNTVHTLQSAPMNVQLRLKQPGWCIQIWCIVH